MFEAQLTQPAHLNSLSALSAKSFPSTEELIDAILTLVSEQLGLRTSFLTHITRGDNINHIVAVHNAPGGCDLAADVDIPLEDTFCSAIASSTTPAPLLINSTRTDPTFQLHRATVNSPHIGSFLGVPVVFSDGEFYGTLCLIDPEEQQLTVDQADLLVVLGRIIATQIERDREVIIRQHAEVEQARLYQVAQEAIREREVFLSIASHELKNPLASLLGYAYLLQRRMHGDERDQRAVQTIVTQAERLNQMLIELLDVSRLESGQFPIEILPLDLSPLIHRIVEDIQPTLTKHTVTIDDSDIPMMIAGDSDRLTQVLRNLVGNAIKYTPDGGQIRIHISSEDQQARVSVQDEGIGIPADAIPHVFQRFYRASNTSSYAIGGFGIGLYVVKEIVTRHNGTIGVISTEGTGTTFTIFLPLLAAPA